MIERSRPHRKFKNRAQIIELGKKQSSIRRIQPRILYRQGSDWIVFVGIGQSYGENEAKQDEEEGEDELADYGLPEPQGVVGSLHEHRGELLEPEVDPCVMD